MRRFGDITAGGTAGRDTKPGCARPGRSSVREHIRIGKQGRRGRSDLAAPGTGAPRRFRPLIALAGLAAWIAFHPAAIAADAIVDLANPASADSASALVTIDPGTQYQEIWGFGAAACGPAKNFERLDEKVRNQVLNLLFSTNGNNAGLSVIRLLVNPDLSPARGQWNWNADRAQVSFVQAAAKRGPVQIFGVPWTPPPWMKNNNSQVQGTLKRENYELFAEYLYDWAEKYRKDYGMDVRWVSPENEPSATRARYASCIYTPAQMDVLASIVADEFHRKNSPVKVGAPECGKGTWTREYLKEMKTSLAKIDWLAWHNYRVYEGTEQESDFRSYGKPVFMTEVCAGHTQNDPTMKDGLPWGRQICRHLNQDERGYLFWWLVTFGNQISGLVNLHEADGTFIANKRVYVFGQFSRFLRPGDVRIKAVSSNLRLEVTAVKSPVTGRLSVVIINCSPQSIAATISGIKNKTVTGRITSPDCDLARIHPLVAQNGSVLCLFPANSVTSLTDQEL